MVDHLQFGDPSDPGSIGHSASRSGAWQTTVGRVGVPVVGGKVSFYNEDSTTGRAIKPSPLALVVGLVDDALHIPSMGFSEPGDVHRPRRGDKG